MLDRCRTAIVLAALATCLPWTALATPGAREDAIRDRERAAEPLVRKAIDLATDSDATTRDAVLDAIARALEAGACPTRTLTEEAFADLHVESRFRELIREHAHQWSISMTVSGEPGQALRVSGVVSDPEGTPVADALVYVFHTDATGRYNAAGLDEARPRIFGYMRTDDQGRYAFRTIRPAAYPDELEPVEQHIHYEVIAPGFAKKIHRLGFADDPFWEDRAAPRWVVPVTVGDDGVHVCESDIELERS